MRKKNTQEILDEFRMVWGDLYDYSDTTYVDSGTKVKISCREHGVFELLPWQHSKRRSGCQRCGYARGGLANTVKLRKTTEQFVHEAKSLFGDRYDYSDSHYIHSHEEVDVVCSAHGKFGVKPGRHLAGQGCSKCAAQKSFKETLWLDSLGVTVRNVDLKIGGRKCLVDGFDAATNTVYEFHGDFWHGNPEKYASDAVNPMTNTTFGALYERTQQKDFAIRSAGYNLVVQWESHWRPTFR